jgi:hypothetical protein
MRQKADEEYGETYLRDVEVQMLSKNCSAVKDCLAAKEKVDSVSVLLTRN